MKKVILLLILSMVFIFQNAIYAEERNYSKIVAGDQGNPILKITMEYIGKKPVGKFEWDIDWKKKNTDFYNLIFTNLTDKPIEFIKSKRYWKIPVTKTIVHDKMPSGKIIRKDVPDIIYSDYRKRAMYDGNIIEPYGKKVRNNWWSYSSHVYDVTYTDYMIEYDDKEYTFTIYVVYQK